jgi:hypothetical protein
MGIREFDIASSIWTGVPFHAQSSISSMTMFGRSVPAAAVGEAAFAVKQQSPAKSSAAAVPMVSCFIISSQMWFLWQGCPTRIIKGFSISVACSSWFGQNQE